MITDCASCHTTDNWFARYNGPHPGIADEGVSGVNHGGASCGDCHTQTLQTATCTKCQDGNPDGEGGGEAKDMIDLNSTNGIHCKLTDLATDYTEKHGFRN